MARIKYDNTSVETILAGVRATAEEFNATSFQSEQYDPPREDGAVASFRIGINDVTGHVLVNLKTNIVLASPFIKADFLPISRLVTGIMFAEAIN